MGAAGAAQNVHPVLLAAAVAAAALAHGPALTLKPCSFQHLNARCGTLRVPEDRAKPAGRTIGLHVVVVPAWGRTAHAADAVTYIAGGPGGASTELAQSLASQWPWLLEHRDLLLVDQRGTGASNAYYCPKQAPDVSRRAELEAYVRACLKAFPGDPARYGTRTAMDDLDAVRAALGYRQLDVIGGSYGATAAQMFVRLHPASVRSLVLIGATALQVPFFGRWAVNAQRALDQVAKLCRSEPYCNRAFPNWETQFARLVTAWNVRPVTTSAGPFDGVRLAAVVQGLLLGLDRSVSIPLLVARAAKGDYRPLVKAVSGPSDDSGMRQLMFWGIWCNEPWVGLGAKGPWGTAFDSTASAELAQYRTVCSSMPGWSEPASLWTMPSSTRIPVLALEGGADPQDPLPNLPGLKRHFPDSRAVVLPYFGHQFGNGGCVGELITSFVERGTARGLATGCVAGLSPPPFPLR